VESFEGLTIEATEILDAGGDQVFVAILQRGRPRDSQTVVEGSWCQVLTLREGVLARLETYQDRTQALDTRRGCLTRHVYPCFASWVMDVSSEGPYLEVKMPERFLLQFQLKDGSWMDEAVCLRRRLERLDNGSYICSEFSSGLWIRCIADHGDHFEHVDGRCIGTAWCRF
jgi:hypothetical protein